MIHAVVMSLLVSANPASPDVGVGVVAGTPKAAVEKLAAELVGSRAPVEVRAEAFEGLPAPGPMVDYRAVSLGLDQSTMRLSVRLEARTARRLLASRRYVFPLAVREHVVVPRRVIRAGETIRGEDLEVVERPLGGGADKLALSLDQLVGRIARRNLMAGTPVPKRSLRLPALVRRGSGVTVQVRVGRMVVSMKGEALEDGAMGETVRVMNPRSSRVLVGRVVDYERVEVSR